MPQFCPTATDGCDTPVLVVDRDAFDANVALLFSRLPGVAVRPHLKTAKSPVVAGLLQAAGARGVCVAKVSEAEVLLAGGVDDVLITTEVAGTVKAARLARLLDAHPAARVRIVVDALAGARFVADALGPGRTVETLIDVDVGQGRCGVPPERAGALAAALLRDCPALRLVGVQGYEGNLQHVRAAAERAAAVDEAMARLARAVDEVRGAGVDVTVVTTGGTGTAELCAAHDVVTEVQPGSFAFMDADYLATGGVPYAPALAVVATVLSARPDRLVVDAGLKTLSDDSGPAVCVDPAGWSYHHAGDEHGLLRPGPDAAPAPGIGDRVLLRPSHVDTTINLHDELVVVRGDELVDRWPVAARGRVQ